MFLDVSFGQFTEQFMSNTVDENWLRHSALHCFFSHQVHNGDTGILEFPTDHVQPEVPSWLLICKEPHGPDSSDLGYSENIVKRNRFDA